MLQFFSLRVIYGSDWDVVGNLKGEKLVFLKCLIKANKKQQKYVYLSNTSF